MDVTMRRVWGGTGKGMEVGAAPEQGHAASSVLDLPLPGGIWLESSYPAPRWEWWMSCHQQKVKPEAPQDTPLGTAVVMFLQGDAQCSTCRVLSRFYFDLRHLTGCCTWGGWLELGNPRGRVADVTPHGLASPQSPPHMGWVEQMLPDHAGGAKHAAATKSRAENCP